MEQKKKVHVKKGDTVVVISGKDKGKKAKVLEVIPTQGKIIVEGVNMLKKHQKPSQKVQQGGIIQKEGPIYSSKVMPICNKCNTATRTGSRLLDGTRLRTCKKCGEVFAR